MVKAISRRKFLRVMVITHAAAGYHLLFPSAARVAAQDDAWPEQSPVEEQADPAAAAGTVSVHHHPSIIYIKG